MYLTLNTHYREVFPNTHTHTQTLVDVKLRKIIKQTIKNVHEWGEKVKAV